MKKRNATVLILMLITISTMYAQTVNYDAAVRNVVMQIIRATNENEIVAIVSFDSTSEQFSSRLINDVTRDLIDNGVQVVERQKLDEVLKEQDFQLSGNVSDESMQSIGRMLGASSIVIGNGENMVEHYSINFRILSVETAQVMRQITQDVKYNASMRRLLAVNKTSDGIGSTKVYIGGILGLGIGMHGINEEFYTALGFESSTPREEAGLGFPLSFYVGYQITDRWAIQSGLNFFLNNKVRSFSNTIEDDGLYEEEVILDYNTLDIPIMTRFTIIFSPVMLNVFGGFHLSFAISKLNIDDHGGSVEAGNNFTSNKSISANNVTGGMNFGANVGFKLGPGNIVGGVMFLFDFMPIRGDFINHKDEKYDDTRINTRRALNIMVGYEFKL